MNLLLRFYSKSYKHIIPLVLVALFLFDLSAVAQKKMSPKKIEKLKEEAMAAVEENSKLTQVMVDKIFSFSELGFQEVETSKYITGILEENGFTIERGISGVPTAWTATWGSGKPVIAIGSDLDCIPKASQKPGVAYHDPIIEGAPGHGEGHNSGQAVNVTAVLAVKDIMEREGLPGTLMLWPGVAEEQVATKAFFVRDGYFDDVDACIFTHVGNNLETSYGSPRGNGMISVEFSFDGEAAHGAGSPWRGRSSLDAVELMNVGWNFRREHLQPTQRSHYVITDGGDQPNVVPAKASVWYYLRDRTYSDIKKMYDIAINIAKGAAMMTDTEMSYRYLGSAWPGHFNKVIAETAHKNIEKVGLPEWSEDDQTLAKAVQEEVGSDPEGLATELEELGQPVKFSLGGGSDDIADISWAVPTIVLRFPSNMPGLQGHHWSNAITMATPIAHKGATAGAKAEAMTLLDLFLKPELIEEAWTYYKDEQTKDVEYEPLLNPDDKPAIELNQEIMATFRPELEKYYFDETKYDTYLEQLGIEYPTLRSDAASVDSESERK
ncbi:amidohydrolase [Tunicatimonas sp.]|uniref:amidohydrolase n=1 Tax=Tunicatimonas sp. TaxID=1940096 RepID=UPI003C7485BB